MREQLGMRASVILLFFFQVKISFDEFRVQPPILGDCKLDKMFVVAGGNELPVFCGMNDGQHVYIDVAGKATTEINMVVRPLRSQLYSCADRFGLKDRLVADNVTVDAAASGKNFV